MAHLGSCVADETAVNSVAFAGVPAIQEVHFRTGVHTAAG